MSKRTKVLFLTHNYPRFEGDYSGVFLSILANKLHEQDIDTVVLAPHDAGAPVKETVNSVTVYRFKYHKDEQKQTLAYRGNMHNQVFSPVGLLRLRSFLKKFEKAALEIIEDEKVDLIAGHWLIPTGFVMKGLLKTGLPMVISSHGSDIRLLGKFGSFLVPYLKPLLREVKRWTVVSSYLKDAAIKAAPYMAEKLEVLPLPNDESMFYPDDSVEREENLVIAVTRFNKQKRIMQLIKAFKIVHDRLPDARLELYGGGELLSELEQFIQSNGLISAVTITGPIPQNQLSRVYNRASTLVLNSVNEGFGLALTEAMLCGTPVIGTKSGGIVDIIKDGETGMLVRPEDISMLADAVYLMLADKKLQRKLAEAGMQDARRRFSSASLAGRYAEILREATRNSNSQSK